MESNTQTNTQAKDLGEKFFQLRDYTPIPLFIVLIMVQNPTVLSATLGTLLAVFGELIRVYSVAFIGSISRTRKSSLGAKLVTSGPFGIVRNPLYVGNFFIVLGISLFSAVSWMVLLTVICFTIQYYFIVVYEEKLLVDQFGEEFEHYCKRVPAWIPTSLPKLENIEWPDSFSGSLKSEKRTLTAIAVVLLLLTFFS